MYSKFLLVDPAVRHAGSREPHFLLLFFPPLYSVIVVEEPRLFGVGIGSAHVSVVAFGEHLHRGTAQH